MLKEYKLVHSKKLADIEIMLNCLYLSFPL